VGGEGGNITIDPEVVLLENDSHIRATAVGGTGGRITISAENYFAFQGSEVDVRAGDPALSGTIELHAPDVDLAGNLTELPTSYLDADSLMRERCAARRSGEASGSFAVRGPVGIPPEPDGWLRASVEADAGETAEAAPALPLLTASFSGLLLAKEGCE
jgi:large exoprotein involved in heme utilization and adhesion